jgi:GR25 family glycosyltransferase involved in LPS biosynthesis
MQLFYVNLDYRQDRNQSIHTQLKSLIKTISYIRFNACKGNDETLNQLLDNQFISISNYISVLSENNSFMTRGTVGCFLSHYELFKYSVEKNQILIILEDDVFIHHDIEKYIINGLHSIQQTFDIIYLGQPMNRWESNKTDYNEYFWKIKDGYYGTFGYIIHPHYALFLINQLKSIENHIDNMILDLNIKFEKTVLLFKILLVNTDVMPNRNSDIILNKRMRRFRFIIIPLIFYLLHHQNINHQKKILLKLHPNFQIIIKNNKNEIDYEMNKNGGFFVNTNIILKYSIQNIIHNYNNVIIKNFENDFYGKSDQQGNSLILSPLFISSL